MKKPDDALLYFDKTLSLNKLNADALLGKGLCWFHKQNLEESQIYFDKSIEINPNNCNPYKYKGDVALKLSKFEDAI